MYETVINDNFKKIIATVKGVDVETIVNSVGGVVPNDPANRDYIRYQKWLQQGNQPEIIDRR